MKGIAQRCFFLMVCCLLNGFASLVLAADDALVPSEGLRDIRPPISYPTNYFLLIGFIVLVVLSALAIFLYRKWKRKEVVVADPMDTRTPWEIAYDQLDALSQRPYLQEGQFKEYYSELSGIVRYYFENRFHIRAPEMTTEEFLWSLERSGELRGDHKETLKKFMTSCDIVKFAKHIPLVEEAQESFRFARQLVDETKMEIPVHNPV